MTHRPDLYVLGGGIAGLAAAALAGRRGRRVTLLERARHLGGRARSRDIDGDVFNLGPHALYVKGPGRDLLDTLGVPYGARKTDPSGSLAIRGGRLHALPVGAMSLLTSGLLALGDKLAFAELLTQLRRRDPADFAGRSVQQVVAELAPRPRVAALLLALLRLATYCHDPKHTDAPLAFRQLLRANEGGVIYVDGGWQTLVSGLEAAARDAGVVIEMERSVSHRGELGDVPVIVATPPRAASKILGRSFDVRPVRAACLDLALTRVPRPRRWFTLGVGEPLYISVHTRYAQLSSRGHAIVHAMRYLAPDEPSDAVAGRASIEGALDIMQPGWRDHVAHERFSPSFTVAHAHPGGRPSVDQGDCFIAGDWVASDHLLADGALATARRAVELATARGSEAGWAA